MPHVRLLAPAFAAAALLSSCGGDDLVLPSEGEPAAITIIQGNGQSGRVGEVLAQPLIVEVLDGADRPVPSATVVVDLAGAVAVPETLSTDAQGWASAEITLGSQVGTVAGAVRVIAPESPAEVEASFTVIALAASADGLAGVSGDGQTGVAGTVLPEPLVVIVTDAFGNPIEGVAITWSPDAGSVSETATLTDAEGRSFVTRTLGPTAGAQTTLATSEGLAGSPVVFNHTATAGSATGVVIVSGNGQTAPAGTTLPQDLVVQVVDQDGNPVVGAAVTWVVTAGGGTLDPTTGTTDATGQAATQWTLGPSVGTNTAQAIVSGVGEGVFTATAAAGPPSTIRIVSGDGQTGEAGSALPAQLVVQVLDGAGNPVGGAMVAWSVQSGGGSVSPASGPTDTEGRAATAWTLGPSAGTQRVQASSSGAGSVRFEATATAGAPDQIRLVSGDGQTAVAGTQLASGLVVQVIDAGDNPVSGVTVTWTVESGDGSVSPQSATTGADGQASASWTLGPGAGTQSVLAAAPGAGSVRFQATATAGAPSEIRAVSGDGQSGTAGALLPSELVIEVVDAAGNPVSGVAVTWTVTPGEGSVSPATGTTDADGRASTGWTLGPTPGTQQVEASAPGAGSVVFQATAS